MQDVVSSGVSADELKQFIERIERLAEDKKAVSDDMRDVYAEAKGCGFEVKALRALIKLRSLAPNDREEQEEILELYKNAVGMA
jgi:uncharacterized protein (UPF0335 family)